jgi:hypothetical protein
LVVAKKRFVWRKSEKRWRKRKKSLLLPPAALLPSAPRTSSFASMDALAAMSASTPSFIPLNAATCRGVLLFCGRGGLGRESWRGGGGGWRWGAEWGGVCNVATRRVRSLRTPRAAGSDYASVTTAGTDYVFTFGWTDAVASGMTGTHVQSQGCTSGNQPPGRLATGPGHSARGRPRLLTLPFSSDGAALGSIAPLRVKNYID